MRTINTKVAFAGALLATFAITGVASAQCATCAVPQTVWSPVVTPAPVVVNNVTVDDGWYLGKYLGRANRRIWGSAPAQAQVVGMPVVAAAPATTWSAGYAPATTWSAAYAPATTWATSYAPSCSTCGTSPCGCAQTTFRPVIMQPAVECNACNTCAPCSSCASGVVTTSYSAPADTGCSTCAAGASTTYAQPAPSPAAAAPSLPSNSPAPPQTFREADRLDPTPAEAAPADQASDLSAPLLLDAANGDKMTKRPTAPVWTAVYKHPAKITSVSAAGAEQAKPAAKQTIGWTSGR